MRIKVLISLIILSCGLLWVETAAAHSGLLRSSPGQDAVIAAAPARVELWFTQELFRRKTENTILVRGPQGSPVQNGAASLDDDDRTHLSVELLPDLPAGEYLVTWRNVSVEDGHPSEGSFRFMIDPLAQVTSTPQPAAVPSEAPTPTQPAAAATPVTTTAPGSAPAGPCAAGLVPALGLLAAAGLRPARNWRRW